jgi:peroxiredoxin
LIAAPRDQLRTNDDDGGVFDQGIQALVRSLIKFERWEEILDPATIPWRETATDRTNRAFAETLAHIGTGNLVDARAKLAELRAFIHPQSEEDRNMNIDLAVAADAAEGDLLEASRLLLQASAAEQKKRDEYSYRNDPPPYPWTAYRVLGDMYLSHGEHRLAIEAYSRGLKAEHNDAFALSGLARAHFALGDRDAAARYAGRLQHVWSAADDGLRWKSEVAKLGLQATPIAETPAPEREYRPELLTDLGPVNWEPYTAPELKCLDADGKTVRLEDFRGKNVLLVFYLGEQCVHCVEQLVAINERSSEWAAANTVVLAVSSTAPEQNKESLKLGGMSVRLLSDIEHTNARRFTSYDDFEDLELHSTILIDTRGRVHWKRTGGDPFTDMEFLLTELKRMNELALQPSD